MRPSGKKFTCSFNGKTGKLIKGAKADCGGFTADGTKVRQQPVRTADASAPVALLQQRPDQRALVVQGEEDRLIGFHLRISRCHSLLSRFSLLHGLCRANGAFALRRTVSHLVRHVLAEVFGKTRPPVREVLVDSRDAVRMRPLEVIKSVSSARRRRIRELTIDKTADTSSRSGSLRCSCSRMEAWK